jgi:hypothetical protein
VLCLDPLDLEEDRRRPILEALTTDGDCRVYERVETGVTIWITAGSRERMRRWRESMSVGSSQPV